MVNASHQILQQVHDGGRAVREREHRHNPARGMAMDGNLEDQMKMMKSQNAQCDGQRDALFGFGVQQMLADALTGTRLARLHVATNSKKRIDEMNGKREENERKIRKGFEFQI